MGGFTAPISSLSASTHESFTAALRRGTTSGATATTISPTLPQPPAAAISFTAAAAAPARPAGTQCRAGYSGEAARTAAQKRRRSPASFPAGARAWGGGGGGEGEGRREARRDLTEADEPAGGSYGAAASESRSGAEIVSRAVRGSAAEAVAAARHGGLEGCRLVAPRRRRRRQ